MKKQNCPHCGKIDAGYNHVRLCAKKPQEPPGEATEAQEPIVEVAEAEAIKVEPSKPTIPCPICGSPSIKLNALDYDCPKCGCIDPSAQKLLAQMKR
mgnify:CR=1 FL=1